MQVLSCQNYGDFDEGECLDLWKCSKGLLDKLFEPLIVYLHLKHLLNVCLILEPHRSNMNDKMLTSLIFVKSNILMSACQSYGMISENVSLLIVKNNNYLLVLAVATYSCLIA